ncbi:MAG: 6-bladed beta-propeller [Alistipes sp.]|nr:6-bladed beta-propeller [Alistipes sp.]
MKRLSFLLLTSLLFTACSKDKQKNVYEVDTSAKAPIEEFINREVACIELETTAESMIGNIQSIEYDKDNIYIKPSYNAESILRFDRHTGKFINSIGRKGRGPNEYTHFLDFTIGDGKAYVLSSKKIYVYDIDGKFQQTIDTANEHFYNLTLCDDGKIWLASNTCNESLYEYHLLNPETGEIEVKMCEFPEYAGLLVSGTTPFIHKEGKDYLVARLWDQTIYRLSDDSYEPYLTIDFHRPNSLTAEQRKTLSAAIIDELMEKDDYFYYHAGITQNNRKIITIADIHYKHENRCSCMVKIDNKSGKAKYTQLTFSKSEKLPYLKNCWFGYAGRVIDNMVVGFANAHDINQTERFKHLKDDDNPVLFFYELNME